MSNRNRQYKRNKKYLGHSKKHKKPLSQACGPNLAHWRPEDDYLLINSVLITSNLTEVYYAVRFSAKFTEKDLEQRWRELLFDNVVSQTSRQAVQNLPGVIKTNLDRKIPFNTEEENLLTAVKYSHVFNSQTDMLAPFNGLLLNNPDRFYPGRTASDLFKHWNRLISCRLVPDDPCFQVDNSSFINNTEADPESFSDTEILMAETVTESLNSGINTLRDNPAVLRRTKYFTQKSYHGFRSFISQHVLHELSNMERQEVVKQNQADPQMSKPQATRRQGTSPQKSRELSLHEEVAIQQKIEMQRKKRRLIAKLRSSKEEAVRWTRLMEIRGMKGIEMTDPTPNTNIATLMGLRARYVIKGEETTFGRSSYAYKPDIDLSREGDSSKVSRCHGKIRLAQDGTFWLSNFSSHAVFVNGIPVLKNEEIHLEDQAIIGISRIALRFDINWFCLNFLCKLTVDLPVVKLLPSASCASPEPKIARDSSPLSDNLSSSSTCTITSDLDPPGVGIDKPVTDSNVIEEPCLAFSPDHES
ncbi:Microspherule protein 1 [Cichlidogyrus casuarinus]|uniref:Microspherule protein 1 n=1 Tax=Cichlidogyrus casuarinus TaxID=1844966 RepID=A0ABD2QJ24_9PLAT